MRLLAVALFLLWAAGCSPKQTAGSGCTMQVGELCFTRAFNDGADRASFVGDTLIIESGPRTDYFNAPDGSARSGNAPILACELDNSRPFTFTARVRPSFGTVYDAGALYLFSDTELWQKFAFEMDERGKTRLVTVLTRGTSDDNNHDAVAQESVWMKISSDTRSVGFYYSVDGVEWQLVRLYANDYPARMWLGLSSQSPVGEGIAVYFDGVALQPVAVTDFRMGV